MNPVVLNNKLLLVAVTELLVESVQHFGCHLLLLTLPNSVAFSQAVSVGSCSSLETLQTPNSPCIHSALHTHPLMGWQWDVRQACLGLLLIVHLGDRILFIPRLCSRKCLSFIS